MIRVLQIGLSFEYGGIESFVMNYYRHIDKSKIQFDFINLYDKPLAYEEEIHKLGGIVYKIADFHKRPLRYKKDLRSTMKSYSVVHIHMLSAANMIPLLVAKKLKIKKIIAHSHNSSPEGFLRGVLHIINYKKIKAFATNLFACSCLAGDWMFGKDADYFIVRNAIAADKYIYQDEARYKLRQELRINPNAIVYGNVGRLNIQKNQVFLLKIFSKILEKQQNSYLCIIGDGELRNELSEMTEKLGISNQVILLGRRMNVNKLYNIFDAIIMPSLFEGLPLTLIEAQANGLKCFVSEGGISEESNVLHTMEFVNLNEGEEKWAQIIVTSDLTRDFNALKKITNAHFDITTESNVLENKYMEV